MNMRVVRNLHGSAEAACDAWLAGSLWGHPIALSIGNIHVYGWHRKSNTTVNVQFERNRITVVRPKGSDR